MRLLITIIAALVQYKRRIAGKFGGENIWQIYNFFQVFGRKKFDKWIDQPNGY